MRSARLWPLPFFPPCDTRFPWKRLGCGLFLAAVGALRVVNRALSEVEMVAKLRRHRAEFEQIRLMLRKDNNVEIIGPDWTMAKPGKNGELSLGIFPARLALYRECLGRLDFRTVYSQSGRVRFEEFGGGLTDTSWGIGYVWSATPPAPRVKSAYTVRPPRDKMHFSPIDGHWFLYQRR